MRRPILDIDSLSPQQRLDLIQALWESLETSPENVPLTAAQRAELDRRLDQLESDEEVQGAALEDVGDRLCKRTR